MSAGRALRWSLSLIVMTTSLSAQQIADRVAAVGNGSATFHFTARPGVCGDGQHFIRVGRHSYQGSWSSETRYSACEIGPVQVRMTVHDGTVERVETWVGPLRSRDAQDLGAVSAADAARYLLGIAARGNAYASPKAIFPAVLADSATVWPSLLTIAHDMQGRSNATRQDAMFWLSRYAAGATAGRRNSPFDEDDDDADSGSEDLKSHAVFVLSQLPHGEGVENLLEVARTNKDPHVRSKALFWLGQSGDPRALSLFESILRG
jgi:hypothetical protein